MPISGSFGTGILPISEVTTGREYYGVIFLAADEDDREQGRRLGRHTASGDENLAQYNRIRYLFGSVASGSKD